MHCYYNNFHLPLTKLCAAINAKRQQPNVLAISLVIHNVSRPLVARACVRVSALTAPSANANASATATPFRLLCACRVVIADKCRHPHVLIVHSASVRLLVEPGTSHPSRTCVHGADVNASVAKSPLRLEQCSYRA